jgi:hypothetical protein
MLAPSAEFPLLEVMLLTEVLQNIATCPQVHAQNLITVCYIG